MVNSPFLRKNDLNKSKLIFIFILGILLFSSLIHTSSARLSTGVEVKEGERYKWVIKLNISNYIELLSNTGDETIPTELVALNLQGNDNELMAVDLILEIHDTPDPFFIDSYFNVMISLFEGTLGVTPDFNISQIPIFFPLNFSIKLSPIRANFSILKADTQNYFTIPIGFFLIVPTDLDWAIAATQLQSYFGRNLVSSNYTVSRQDNGLKMTQPADRTIFASELNLNYNSKGVLETADGSYDGSVLFSLELESESSIAFEIPFLLSIAAIAVTILILRKRKKYTLIS